MGWRVHSSAASWEPSWLLSPCFVRAAALPWLPGGRVSHGGLVSAEICSAGFSTALDNKEGFCHGSRALHRPWKKGGMRQRQNVRYHRPLPLSFAFTACLSPQQPMQTAVVRWLLLSLPLSDKRVEVAQQRLDARVLLGGAVDGSCLRTDQFYARVFQGPEEAHAKTGISNITSYQQGSGKVGKRDPALTGIIPRHRLGSERDATGAGASDPTCARSATIILPDQPIHWLRGFSTSNRGSGQRLSRLVLAGALARRHHTRGINSYRLPSRRIDGTTSRT